MQGYKCIKYTSMQAQGYMPTKLQNDVKLKTVTFQNMLQYKDFDVATPQSQPPTRWIGTCRGQLGLMMSLPRRPGSVRNQESSVI